MIKLSYLHYFILIILIYVLFILCFTLLSCIFLLYLFFFNFIILHHSQKGIYWTYWTEISIQVSRALNRKLAGSVRMLCAPHNEGLEEKRRVI